MAQARVDALNGQRHTYYCGAHLRFGFHEDGLVSALRVTERLGVVPDDGQRERSGARPSPPIGWLYTGHVWHARSAPRHAFRYRTYMHLFDLDEVGADQRDLRLLGYNRPAAGRAFTMPITSMAGPLREASNTRSSLAGTPGPAAACCC